jgi:predicted RNA polymerase sigma factor
VQAAIAAVHAEAPSDAETDWAQVVGLYEVLEQLAPNPVVTLNRAIALGMATGPAAGLRLLAEVASGPLAGHHRVYAAEGFLRQRAGEAGPARAAYVEAARLASNRAEQRLLLRRAAGCGD